MFAAAVNCAYRFTRESKSMTDDQDKWKPARYIDYRDGCHGIMYYGKGGGYNWHAVIEYLVRSRHPEIADAITYDPESSMFVARSENVDALHQVALLVKEAAEDPAVYRDALAKAKADLKDDVD
jgi:hypothetical protein